SMNFDSLLEWFSGKSRETIVTFTLPALAESKALEYWKKGVARSVRASLNKQNVAARWAKELEEALEVDYKHPLRAALSNMRYGSYGLAPSMLTVEALAKLHATTYIHIPKRGPA